MNKLYETYNPSNVQAKVKGDVESSTEVDLLVIEVNDDDEPGRKANPTKHIII